jgi:uncharacterized repeat protein (TIGR01451 family)
LTIEKKVAARFLRSSIFNHQSSIINLRGFAMHVGVLRLRRALPVAAVTALLASFAVGHPPAPGGGIFPVPGMGPPGAVAGVGAMVPPAGPPHAAALPAPAPLVAAKFIAPKGVRVTAFPGSNLAKMYDAPVIMALRPGYVFRFELTNLPYNPGRALYPEVEVRGTLVPRPGLRYMDYPIPLVFSLADIERALRGALVTKVIYLEDPEKAIPAQTQPDYPIETPDDSEREALKNARENGRLMAIVRLGDRRPSAEEFQTVAVDGTILLPGEKYLKAPALPPVFPFWGVPMYDPLLGPKGPKEECFVNGDDKADPLGIGFDGRLGGLNPTDVGVEYTIGGKRRVTTSSMACICAPRYMIRRAELAPAGIDARQIIAANVGQVGTSWFKERAAPMLDIGREKANEFVGRMRPSIYVGRIGTSFWVGTSKPAAIGQVEGVKVTGALVEPEQLTAYPALCPLTVTKVVDPPGPKQSGDVVTITIRYANTGARAISDIVVSDSLSGRLEYIPGSAASDRPANFTAFENEAGSVVVRWELPGTLLPGQAGTIKFRAKVR